MAKKKEKPNDDFSPNERELQLIEALSRPYLEVDDEFLIRKDFIIAILKYNNFEEDIYSIIIFHEALDESIGQVWQRECFKSATPQERDMRYNMIRMELNSVD